MNINASAAQSPSGRSRRKPAFWQASQRGSVLVVSLLLAAIIALSLGSFLKLSTSAVDLSQRSLFMQSALSVAEAGIEQAIWSMNNGTANAWAGGEWVANGDQRLGTFAMDLGQNVTATVKVWVEDATPAAGSSTTIVAKAIIDPPGNGPELTRWVRVVLRKDSVFSFGMVGRDGVTFNGQPEVDSYNSSLGAYNAALASGGNNIFDRGTVGVVSASNNALNIGNGSVWGSAAVGANSLSAIAYGPQADIGARGSSGISTSAVQTNFSADFPEVSAPTPGTVYDLGAISGNTALPRGGDSASSGRYYYRITGISLSGSKWLNLNDHVTLIISNALHSVSIAGNSGINVNAQGSLELYTPGNVSIAGNGVTNHTNTPAKFQVWSTRVTGSAGTQSISVSGNGVLSAVVYAPDADVSINGGGNSGNVYGAIVGKSVTMNGSNARFHYDEALADMGGNGRWGVRGWTELVTAAERAAYAGQF